MKRWYQWVLLALAAGAGAIVWVTADPTSALPGALILGSAAVPLAVFAFDKRAWTCWSS